MTPLPPWATSLAGDARLLSELGLRWFSEPEREAIRDEWRAAWVQAPFDEPFHGECLARLERCLPLAVGPTRARRLTKAPSSLAVVFDPEAPDVAWLSLSSTIPSLAWADGGASAEALREAFARYTQPLDLPLSALEERTRIVKDIASIKDVGLLAETILACEPWVDDALWGSASNDDPWIGHVDEGALTLSVRSRRAALQAQGVRPSLSLRTLWSRSVLKIEQHPFGLWVFELRYRPSRDARALVTLGSIGRLLPSDLPVDLAASVLRASSVTRALLTGAPRPFGEASDYALCCALDAGDPQTTFFLREAIDAWRDDPRLGDLCDVLDVYGYRSLLREAASVTTDPSLREQIVESLVGPAAPRSAEVQR